MKGSAKKVYAFLSGVLIASVLLAVVVFIAGWIYVFHLSSEMGKTETESDYLQKEVAAMDNLEKNFATISESESLTIDSVPKDKEVSSFMADMEGMATKNKLKITESVIGFNKDQSKLSDPSLSQMTKIGNYYELKVKFSLEGSYSSFINFVNQVNSMRRVTNISTVTLLRTTEAIMNRKDDVKASFVSSIYIKK